MGETVGWNDYIQNVQAAAAAVPAGQLSHMIVLAANYGQAGALYLARRSEQVTDLPPVYSEDNALWSWGPPPESADEAIVVGEFPPNQLQSW